MNETRERDARFIFSAPHQVNKAAAPALYFPRYPTGVGAHVTTENAKREKTDFLTRRNRRRALLDHLKQISWALFLVYIILLGLVFLFGKQIGYTTSLWACLGVAGLTTVTFFCIYLCDLLRILITDWVESSRSAPRRPHGGPTEPDKLGVEGGENVPRTLLIFGSAVLGACALIWGAEALFPKTLVSAIVLVSVIVLGLLIIRPGWGIQPKRFGGYWLVLFGALLASGAAAAWFAILSKVPLPYDVPKLNIIKAMPAILGITGLEELLFRQVMYRWLEQREVSSKIVIVATALAFGLAHLGPIFIGSPIGPTFYLLTSGYMVWIGVLLGEIRRAAGSWLLPWLGHFGYNVTILYILSVAYIPAG